MTTLTEEVLDSRIVKNFTWREAVISPTALAKNIDNTPNAVQQANIVRVARDMMTIRWMCACPIKVTSWFRCPELNAAVKGSKNSAHMAGLAIDFKPHDVVILKTDAEQKEALRRYFEAIRKSDMPYDRLIIEGTTSGSEWIHYQIEPNGRKPRREALEAKGSTLGGKMVFTRIKEN